MSGRRFRKRAGADAVTLAVSRRPVSGHLPTALRIFVRAGYGPMARHITPETELRYKVEGGGQPHTKTVLPLVCLRARLESVVHGVARQQHW